MKDTVAQITIMAHLGIYPLTYEIGGFRMLLSEDTIRYWDTGRELALKQATEVMEKLLDEIKAEIDKQRSKSNIGGKT